MNTSDPEIKALLDELSVLRDDSNTFDTLHKYIVANLGTHGEHSVFETIDSVRGELAQLRATAARRLELLKECGEFPTLNRECPVCQAHWKAGHTPVCPLAKELLCKT